MAGRFSNTQYTDTVNSLLGSMQELLNHNYYKYTDKPPTPVEYFHINKDSSTLDEGAKIVYDEVGHDSPFRFNHITNMLLYGIETPMGIQYSQEEFGVESAAIEGEAVILPNTIIPYPNDQFIITYLKETIVFKVTHVDVDTLENGSNMYKISYRSSTAHREELMAQVVEEFEFIVTNVGTQMNPILKSSIADFMKRIDQTLISLKQYYKRVFYNKRVQTFTFRHLESNFYDPYMIEFIRKNKLLEGDGEYIYVQHQTTLEPLFPMVYQRTIFSCLERKDPYNIDSYIHRGAGRLLENKFTIFINRMEEYWEIYYNYPNDFEGLQQIPCFKDVFIHHVSDGKTIETRYTFYNIIIKYLYDSDIDNVDLDSLLTIDYDNGPTLFYAIPCIIYCLEQCLNKLLTVET